MHSHWGNTSSSSDSTQELERVAPWSSLKNYQNPDPDGLQATNRALNRYRDIVASRGSRVRLPTGRYINADWVKLGKEGFIATQAPLETTVTDFAEMLIETNAKVIVTLGSSKDDPSDRMHVYWKVQEKFGDYSIYPHREVIDTTMWCERDLLVTKAPPKDHVWPATSSIPQDRALEEIKEMLHSIPGFAWNELQISHETEAGSGRDDPAGSGNVADQVWKPNWKSCEKYGRTTPKTSLMRHIHFYVWPDHGIIPSPCLVALALRCKALINDLSFPYGPVVVHCSAGIGRTGTFIAAWLGMTYISKVLPCQARRSPTRGSSWIQQKILERAGRGRTSDSEFPPGLVESFDSIDRSGRGLSELTKYIVESIRQQRNGAVQTPKQYVLIFSALKIYYHMEQSRLAASR